MKNKGLFSNDTESVRGGGRRGRGGRGRGGRGRGGRGRRRGRGRGRGKCVDESSPHQWEERNWRQQCGSISGIADSCPINYKEILSDLQSSSNAKDKELMGVLESIKEKSVLFGQADDPFKFSADEMALLLPDVSLDSDESKAMLSILGKSDGSNSDEVI